MGDRADSLHKDIFVMDGLSAAYLTESYVTETLPSAGVDALHKTVIAAGADHTGAIEAIKELQGNIERWEGVNQAQTVDELTADGLSILFGFQDTTPLDDDPENVELFADLGIRVIQLTYNQQNRCGTGCTAKEDHGLTSFGTEVIDAIERHEVLLDLSHVGQKTATEALEVASAPTIFSHSNPAEVHEHPRNITDELIHAAAESGGTVGVNAYPAFVGKDPTIDDLIDHIEYLIELIGPDRVTLGLDFIDNLPEEKLQVLVDDPAYPNPPYTYPEGLLSASDIPNITSRLLDRGFSEAEVRGIMGENLLDLYNRVWS